MEARSLAQPFITNSLRETNSARPFLLKKAMSEEMCNCCMLVKQLIGMQHMPFGSLSISLDDKPTASEDILSQYAIFRLDRLGRLASTQDS
jgi:hypothetical protein